MINISTSGVTNIYLGTSGATAVYLGNDLVWSTGGHSYLNDYFTIKALSAGTFTWNLANMQYSLNDGEWTSYTANSSISMSQGDTLRWKGTGRANENSITTDFPFDAEGNSMSLFYGDNFTTATTLNNSAFNSLFRNSKIRDARHLEFPATILERGTGTWGNVFGDMFRNSEIVYGPENGFKWLTINGTSSGYYVAANMFEDCVNLLSCGDFEIGDSVMKNSFEALFKGCTSMVKSPKFTLTGTTYGQSFLYNLFNGCSSMNEITILTPNLSSMANQNTMTSGVAATGTFTKSAGTSWNTGTGAIPSGWTVISI